MSGICVITGGGSGMGLETAKLVGKDKGIILCGRTVSKLDGAIEELRGLGIDAEAFPCDVTDRASVGELAKFAAGKGEITTVINSAGVARGAADKVFVIDAVGTVYVDDVFGEAIADGGVILNVASMAGHMLPEDKVPYQLYRMALDDPEAFRAAGLQMISQIPEETATGAAYTIAKKFVIWYTQHKAVQLGGRGVRVVSISPGTFETPMVVADTPEGRAQSESYGRMGALGRVGEPIEIARMMNFMVSDQASYLTGTDVLYDGGVIAAMAVNAEKQ
jgi:NAD(P)-dependent dehydrogenase (short-subunit alcohol dehydrogenase family)